HPLFAGFLPAIREKIVARLDGHDLVFAFGAPAFTYHIEGFGPHVPPGATLVQLVDDPGIAAWTPAGDAVIGNLRLAAHDLLARPAPSERPMPAPRPPRARAEAPAAGARMSVAFALQTLADVRAAHDIVVEEAPSARPVMQDYLPFTRSGTFYTMDSGGLGYGMPAAVGAS
ncbi:benzoylformate decarboxylase, partial [Burkholderia thailandensis]|nr:benzoylformate decarboxylase [Burkholderia thailandensis]